MSLASADGDFPSRQHAKTSYDWTVNVKVLGCYITRIK